MVLGIGVPPHPSVELAIDVDIDGATGTAEQFALLGTTPVDQVFAAVRHARIGVGH
jgi:hypothetical protein